MPWRAAYAKALMLGGLMCCSQGWAAVSCSVSVPTPVAFGQYDVYGPTSVDATGVAQVTCTRLSPPNQSVSYSLALSRGLSATYLPSRQMASGANRISYNLNIDAARLQIWGDGTGGSNIVTGATARLTRRVPSDSVAHNIYGRIPAGQDVGVGAYSDTITLTVTY
jgi:spore coat protein U-like protein